MIKLSELSPTVILYGVRSENEDSLITDAREVSAEYIHNKDVKQWFIAERVSVELSTGDIEDFIRERLQKTVGSDNMNFILSSISHDIMQKFRNEVNHAAFLFTGYRASAYEVDVTK
jgi:hypothetical protein